jgi:hypothetical protein
MRSRRYWIGDGSTGLTMLGKPQKLLPQEEHSIRCPTHRYSAAARLTQEKTSRCVDSDRMASPWIDIIETLGAPLFWTFC